MLSYFSSCGCVGAAVGSRSVVVNRMTAVERVAGVDDSNVGDGAISVISGEAHIGELGDRAGDGQLVADGDGTPGSVSRNRRGEDKDAFRGIRIGVRVRVRRLEGRSHWRCSSRRRSGPF